jgi:regulatory protein
MDSTESAKQLAVNYIEYAARTVAEVRRRLQRAGYEEDVIDSVIEDLQRASLLNDSKFSEDWVDSRTRTKKLGKVRLARELQQKGISREEADKALEAIDSDTELTLAMELARKKLPAHELEALTSSSDSTGSAARAGAKRRLSGFLQRRGYKWEIIEQVFTKLFSNED